MIDRAAQKAGLSYSGVKGIAMADASVQESMGPVQDRTKENLVSTDNAIIMARHRGEAPANYPEIARFLTEIGVDSISVNPASLMRTIAVVAEAEASNSGPGPKLAATSSKC